MKNVITIFLAFVSMGLFAQDSPGVYTIQNAKINTSYSDFGTAFLGDNKVVFASPKEGFTFNREEYNGQPFLDLYMGEVTDDGQLIRKQKLSGDINSKYHEGMVSFTKDMKTVYFSANGKIKKVKRKDRKGSITKNTITLQLFKASIDENGEWGHLELLPFNSDDFSTGHPVLNRDDSKLYFVSDRPESLGKTDIFAVDIYEDGTYGQPANLGPTINTAEREMFPFIGKDNVLYFSSDGYPGYGELDVFASKIFDNTVSTPINLEAPVNSEMDDFAYIIDDHKHKGYFSSNREGGRGDDDIYAFTASPPIYIECQQEISGLVKNIDTQELIPNVQIMLFDEQGKKLQSFLSNENDASFSFMQACNTTYTLKGYLEGYLIGEMDIKTVNDLNAKPIEIVMHMSVDPTRAIDVIADASEIDSAASETRLKNKKEIGKAEDVNDETVMTSSVVQEQNTVSSDHMTKAIAAGSSAVLAQSSDEQENAKNKDEIAIEAVNDEEAATANVAVQETGTTYNPDEKLSTDDPADKVQQTTFQEEGKNQVEVAGNVTNKATETGVAVAGEESKAAANQAVKGMAAESSGVLAQGSEPQENAKNKDEVTTEAANKEAGTSTNVAVQESGTSYNPAEKSSADVAADQVQQTALREEEKNQSGLAEEDGINEDAVVSSAPESITSSGIGEKSAEDTGTDMAYSNDQDPGVTDKKKIININSIYFDFDKHNIRYDARLEMDKLVKILKDYPQMKIEVNAHTDIRGTKKYNDTLSVKRADETVQYLINKGIEAERVSGKGFGEMQLAQKCSVKPCTAFEHQLNRRSEFLIFNNGAEDVIVKSGNRLNVMDENKNYYTSNSGLFINYNFFDDDEVYTVQIGAFQGNVQNNKYSKLTDLFHHRYDDGFSRYFAGIFETSSEARKHMRQMRKNGFADAFVVGLKGEERF